MSASPATDSVAAAMGQSLETLSKSPTLQINRKQMHRLPSDLSLLSHLTTLDASHNDLTQLDACIDGLTLLASLSVTFNKLTSLTCDWSRFAHTLTRLDLSQNMLSTVPSELGLCTALRGLFLHANRIQSLPEEICNLALLEELQLKENRLTSLPLHIGNLSALQKLYIHKNKLSDIPPSIGKLLQIHRIYAYRNHLSALPESMENCAALKDLHVYDNRISVIPEGILDLPNIETLMISSNAIPPSLERIYEAYIKNKGIELDYSFMKLNEIDDSFRIQQLLVRPKTINLSNNRLAEVPDWFFELEQYRDVVRVNFNKNQLKILPPSLCCLNLQKIQLHGNLSMNPELQKAFVATLCSTMSPLEKCLSLLRPIRKFNGKESLAFQLYEAYAIKLLDNLFDTQTQRATVITQRIITLAVAAHALDFLSHEKVVEHVDNLWVNEASFRKYLVLRKRRSSWTETGLVDGLKCFWSAVRDIGAQRLHSPKMMFQAFFVSYLVYITLLMALITSHNVTSVRSTYYFTEVVRNSFPVQDITTHEQFWNYMEGDFFYDAHFGPYKSSLTTNNESIGWQAPFYDLKGPVRFRQQRVPFIDCASLAPEINPDYQSLCSPALDLSNQDTSDFGTNLQFQWSSALETGASTLYGTIDFWYSGSGHLHYFRGDARDMQTEASEVKDSGFVDSKTRMVAVEFIVANHNLDLVCFMTLLFEFPASGGIKSTTKISTLNKAVYSNSMTGPLGIQIALLFFSVGFVIHEMKQIHIKGRAYTKDVWNLFDWSMILLLLTQQAIHFRLIVLSDEFSNPSCTSVSCFEHMQEIASLYIVQKNLLSILCLISWTRMLFFFSIQQRLGPMQLGVAYMMRDMVAFLVIMAIFLLGFGSSFFTILGPNLRELSTLRSAGFSITRFLFGDFDFDAIDEQSPILGPLLFISFLVICVILLLNFLIAILSGTYEENKENAEKRYRLLFTETVIALTNSPLPAPINIIYPLWLLVSPHWVRFWNSRFAPKIHKVRDPDNKLEETPIKTIVRGQDHRSISHRSRDQSTVLAERPWTNDGLVHYFEVEVLHPGVNYIGLAFADYPRNIVPGRQPNTFGFSSYSGGLFNGEQQLSLQVSPLWNAVSDVAGCGVDFKRGVVFLTHQGSLVKSMFPIPTDRPIYPAVGLWNYGSALRVNFGETPFRFQGLDEWMQYDFVSAPEMVRVSENQIASASRVGSYERVNSISRTVPEVLQVSKDGAVLSYFDDGDECEGDVYAIASSVFEWVDNSLSKYEMEVEIMNPGLSGNVIVGILCRKSQKDVFLRQGTRYACAIVNGNTSSCRIVDSMTQSGQPKTLDITYNSQQGRAVRISVILDCQTREISFRFADSPQPLYTAPYPENALHSVYANVGLQSFGQCVHCRFTESTAADEPNQPTHASPGIRWASYIHPQPLSGTRRNRRPDMTPLTNMGSSSSLFDDAQVNLESRP